MTSIGDYAFEECKSLESIYIPKGTKERFSEILGRKYTKLLVEKWYLRRVFTTRITDEECAEAVEDECGVV